MLHNSYFWFCWKSIDNVYFNKVAIVAPPAAAHIPVTFETGEYGSTWVLTSFDNPSGFSIFISFKSK
jgi:hypothetical protein